ncbi:MAG: tat (twin-arginine translocation) pathway signal sequence [Pseudomonadota bacterium]
MPKYVLDRRLFLKRSGNAVLGVGAAGLVTFRDPNDAWAIALEHLDAHHASTLLHLARTLYPHDRLGDLYYAVVVEALDGEAKADTATATLLGEGVAKLDGHLGVPFVDLSRGSRTEVVTALIDDPFVQKVRGAAVVHLYNNPLVWTEFGYGGSSAEHGGYLRRGFQDLGWLEAPSADASPAPYFG